jgi:hypothetical protein
VIWHAVLLTLLILLKKQAKDATKLRQPIISEIYLKNEQSVRNRQQFSVAETWTLQSEH